LRRRRWRRRRRRVKGTASDSLVSLVVRHFFGQKPTWLVYGAEVSAG
jgi:hypothetical protein